VYENSQTSTSNIALSFLAVTQSDFTYTVYRRKLGPDEEAVVGTRDLPEDCLAPATSLTERHRYEVSLQPHDGLEQTAIRAWVNPGLTTAVLHQALIIAAQNANSETELPEQMLKREVAFVLRRHGDAREVMWLRAYGLHVLERFGFLLRFALRVPQDSTMPDRRRLELSLTHKNGRLNEDFYLDQNQKIEMFLSHYFHDIARLVLHDGTIVELDAKLSVIPSFTLERRTYLFRAGREGRNQFFGLRDNGPFQTSNSNAHLVFVYTAADREKSQYLFRALRGGVYSTFPGMETLFGTSIGRQNVSGIEVQGFTNDELQRTCATLKTKFPANNVIPIVLGLRPN
jgi:hypothetical protein